MKCNNDQRIYIVAIIFWKLAKNTNTEYKTATWSLRRDTATSAYKSMLEHFRRI